MREEIIKCDLCLKDITNEEHVPQIKIKPKPKGGWRRDAGTYSYYSSEICSCCETVIFEKILSLRVKGSPFRVFRERVISDEPFKSADDDEEKRKRLLKEHGEFFSRGNQCIKMEEY